MVAALAALATVFATALPAAAITGGTIDSTNKYSNVGLIAFYDETGRYRCTATLVTPTVLLTAAHCTAGTIGKTVVTFDWFVDDAPRRTCPRATDDGRRHLGRSGTRVPEAGLPHRHGVHPPGVLRLHRHPNWNDVGVVVLDEPIAGIAAGHRSRRWATSTSIAQPRLNKTLFTLVGYGTEVRQAGAGPQKPTPQSYPIVRRYTDAVGPEAHAADPADQRQ